MRVRLGSVEHDLTTRTLVMGVLRRSGPLDAVLVRAGQLVDQGADLLDVGGAASVSGPSGAAASEEEELAQLVPLVEALRARFNVPLAVETWRPQVLSACCVAGAVVVGAGGGHADPAYLPCAARAGVTVLLTATRLRPPAGAGPEPSDVVGEVRSLLAGRVAEAEAAGLPTERVIVDAGLDLGKTPAQSLTLLRASAAVADLGPPLLLSASCSRFLGVLLDLDVDERRMASHAAAALGIARGCRIVRTTDVRGSRRVAGVLEALLGARLAQVERASAGVGDA